MQVMRYCSSFYGKRYGFLFPRKWNSYLKPSRWIYVSLDNTHTYSTYTCTATRFLAFSHLYCLMTSILHYFKSSFFVNWKFLLINEVQFLWTFFEILFFNVFYYEIKFTYMWNSAEMWSYIVTGNVFNTFCNI